VLAVLAAGGSAALVSDAGTPLVSDPGERLVAATIAAGHAVVAVPGASAVLAALSVAGLPTRRLPASARRERDAGLEARAIARRRWFRVAAAWPRPCAVAEVLGDRPACVARELTKLHEEVARGSLRALAGRFSTGARGEVTIVVGGRPREAAAGAAPDLDAAIRAGLASGETTREIASRLAAECGVPRREAYARALALRARGNPKASPP
jgi:16S rRNA (cytidine1402-2'-O)-methyltransferase